MLLADCHVGDVRGTRLQCPMKEVCRVAVIFWDFHDVGRGPGRLLLAACTITPVDEWLSHC
jgi:hypothetical protein